MYHPAWYGTMIQNKFSHVRAPGRRWRSAAWLFFIGVTPDNARHTPEKPFGYGPSRHCRCEVYRARHTDHLAPEARTKPLKCDILHIANCKIRYFFKPGTRLLRGADHIGRGNAGTEWRYAHTTPF